MRTDPGNAERQDLQQGVTAQQRWRGGNQQDAACGGGQAVDDRSCHRTGANRDGDRGKQKKRGNAGEDQGQCHLRSCPGLPASSAPVRGGVCSVGMSSLPLTHGGVSSEMRPLRSNEESSSANVLMLSAPPGKKKSTGMSRVSATATIARRCSRQQRCAMPLQYIGPQDQGPATAKRPVIASSAAARRGIGGVY